MTTTKRIGQRVWISVEGRKVLGTIVRIWENAYTVSVGERLYDIRRA